MVTTEEELKSQELEEALERATEDAIADADAQPKIDGEVATEDVDTVATLKQEKRILFTVGTTVTAAAMMVGGIFIGPMPRVVAALSGIAGLFIASRAARARSPWVLYGWIAGGVLLTGILAAMTAGVDVLPNLASELRIASTQGDLLRPPVLFQPGWRAILGWTMASIGFAAGWIALELRRPALGLMIPVPVIAFGAISVPKGQQLATGLADLVLLAIGLGMLSSLHEPGAEDEAPGAAYEFRRAMRAAPIVAGVTILMLIASRFNLLFPPPIYDPTQQARKPKTIPLSEVQDRILFEVRAEFSGPWKVGSLDVYDGRDWRLPPFNDDALVEVPSDGIVDRSLPMEVGAEFTIRGLTGAILPGIANTVGIEAEISNDMELSYDRRAGTMRVTQGQFQPGFKYTMASAGIPRIEELKSAARDYPDDIKEFLEIPEPPAAIESLLRQAPSDNLWDRLDFLRQRLLKTVAASGQGVPVSITPARVGEMMTTDPEATPFEMVAAQAMLARWAGVPSRIGYGFDGGDAGPEDGIYLVRPVHGAVFLEVYFKGFGWLPIIGDPLLAKINTSDAPQQFSGDITSSDNISLKLFVPTIETPEGELFQSVRQVIAGVLPAVALIVLLYILWPLPYKAVRRARRRTWAARRGPSARIALAYAEWRDMVTDFGYTYTSDPPLMFLSRFSPDEEHTELAWLVTRALWGDLRGGATLDEAVAAEELSAALRQRLSRAHPWTLRAVAALSRLSIRNPYAPYLGDAVSGAPQREVVHAA